MLKWDRASNFDDFVMNTTDFYSQLATPLTVLYQIFLFVRISMGQKWDEDNIKEEKKLIHFALEKTFLETIKIKVPSNLAEKLKIQMKIYIEYFLEKQLYSPKFSESVSRLE